MIKKPISIQNQSSILISGDCCFFLRGISKPPPTAPKKKIDLRVSKYIWKLCKPLQYICHMLSQKLSLKTKSSVPPLRAPWTKNQAKWQKLGQNWVSSVGNLVSRVGHLVPGRSNLFWNSVQMAKFRWTFFWSSRCRKPCHNSQKCNQCNHQDKIVVNFTKV